MRENGIFLDLGSAYQVSTFDHPGFLFQEFVNFGSSFTVLLECAFL
jgi:hypothetical protein